MNLIRNTFKRSHASDVSAFQTIKDVANYYRANGGSVVVKRINNITTAIVFYQGKIALFSRNNGKVLGSD